MKKKKKEKLYCDCVSELIEASMNNRNKFDRIYLEEKAKIMNFGSKKKKLYSIDELLRILLPTTCKPIIKIKK